MKHQHERQQQQRSKDQSSVELRKGQLINMAAKFLFEKIPELGAELVKEKFKGRLVYEYRCALKINVNEHTLENNIDHHDAEILEKVGTSIEDVRAHLKQKKAGLTGYGSCDKVPACVGRESGLYLGLTKSMTKLNQKVFERRFHLG